MSGAAHVSLKELVKVYGRQFAVKGIDLEIEKRQFVVFVGPSGCGKSTLLRMIAGLETITDGEIRIGGKVRQRPAAARARHRHGVPVLCALSAYDGRTRTWRSG